MTHWLLVVILSGNITFSKIYEQEKDCWKWGKFYTQGIEYDSEFVCITADTLLENVKKF